MMSDICHADDVRHMLMMCVDGHADDVRHMPIYGHADDVLTPWSVFKRIVYILEVQPASPASPLVS